MQFTKTPQAGSLTGTIRFCPEDFQVDEVLGFDFSGEGEHVCLQIRKRGENTDWVARQLARIADVKSRNVSWAGLKDRHAVTTQWFSVWLPGKTAPDWSASLPDSVELLQERRHNRKLRIGSLQGNRFTLIIRDCEVSQAELDQMAVLVSTRGVPNYYGEQRFGHNAGNITRASDWFSGMLKPKNRQQRGIYLSAARSWLFNHCLAERVAADNWHLGIDGDVFQLAGTNSHFQEPIDAELIRRVETRDIHPTGPLWGCGTLKSAGETLAIEQQVGERFNALVEGLERNGLKQERRALRLCADGLNAVCLPDNQVQLSFQFQAGSYATSLLRELGDFSNAADITRRGD